MGLSVLACRRRWRRQRQLEATTFVVGEQVVSLCWTERQGQGRWHCEERFHRVTMVQRGRGRRSRTTGVSLPLQLLGLGLGLCGLGLCGLGLMDEQHSHTRTSPERRRELELEQGQGGLGRWQTRGKHSRRERKGRWRAPQTVPRVWGGRALGGPRSRTATHPWAKAPWHQPQQLRLRRPPERQAKRGPPRSPRWTCGRPPRDRASVVQLVRGTAELCCPDLPGAVGAEMGPRELGLLQGKQQTSWRTETWCVREKG